MDGVTESWRLLPLAIELASDSNDDDFTSDPNVPTDIRDIAGTSQDTAMLFGHLMMAKYPVTPEQMVVLQRLKDVSMTDPPPGDHEELGSLYTDALDRRGQL